MSWWDRFFDTDKTPRQELVLWVEKWKGRGLAEQELRMELRAMLTELERPPISSQGA